MQGLRYPWTPHKESYTNRLSISDIVYPGSLTRTEAENSAEPYLKYVIDRSLLSQINDTIHLAIRNSLNHITNVNTLALSNSRIPTEALNEDELRFLIALLYEIELGFSEAVQDLKDNIVYDQAHQKYQLDLDYDVDLIVDTWNNRAVKIAELMRWFESNIPTLASYINFTRDSALVQLGEKIGVKIQTSSSPVVLNIHTDQGIPTYHTMPANSTVYVSTLNGLGNTSGSDVTDRPVTLTGVNGASLIHSRIASGTPRNLVLTNNPDHLLNKDATYQLTYALQQWNVHSSVIAVPEVLRTLSDLNLNTGVAESVNILDLFSGNRITITVKSSDNSKVQAQLNNTRTSLGVIGSTVGTAIITLTATNPSGSTSTDFNVTVTKASVN